MGVFGVVFRVKMENVGVDRDVSVWVASFFCGEVSLEFSSSELFVLYKGDFFIRWYCFLVCVFCLLIVVRERLILGICIGIVKIGIFYKI